MQVLKLRVRRVPIETGKVVAIVSRRDAEALGIRALDRIKIGFKGNEVVAIVDVAEEEFVRKGEILLSKDSFRELGVKEGAKVDVCVAEKPKSVSYIRKKIDGFYLDKNEVFEIVKDCVEKKLSDIEIMALLTALYIRGISMEEAEYFVEAMVATGKVLEFKRKPIVDKHSIGGIPGDKTTIVAVPTIASTGLTIPKTSSRAITSPAGTADRVECLTNVEFSADEIVEIVNKVGACMVWGGALDLAPADDIFVQIEFPIGIDPMLFPSILSKKKAVGAEYLVIDIPTGRGAKIKSVKEAEDLARDFIELGRRLGIKTTCISTFGEQPLGHAVGPALEAREALIAVKTMKPVDLIDKACSLAGAVFEMVGKGNKETALRIIRKGKAEEKLREIIEAQGGDRNIRPEDIEVGRYSAEVRAIKSGKVLFIDTKEIAAIAKLAGAPKDKGAGIMLFKKMGEKVRKGEVVMKIFSNSESMLELAVKEAEENYPFVIASGYGSEMALKRYL